MVKRIGGFRRKTRAKMRKNYKDRGKISIRSFLQSFKAGDKVVLKAEPAYQLGMYYPRFHGKQGIVAGKAGKCYQVMIFDGNKEKMVVVHPIHLHRVINGRN
ncbi:MAG: 50S ribosomal protein L21e [Nanoarchaeota archaeon]|nr:50S ribosomal protein L21e [Nanoarchaeota archaeon]